MPAVIVLLRLSSGAESLTPSNTSRRAVREEEERSKVVLPSQ